MWACCYVHECMCTSCICPNVCMPQCMCASLYAYSNVCVPQCTCAPVIMCPSVHVPDDHVPQCTCALVIMCPSIHACACIVSARAQHCRFSVHIALRLTDNKGEAPGPEVHHFGHGTCDLWLGRSCSFACPRCLPFYPLSDL